MSNTRACVNVKISEKWLIEAPRLARSLDSNRGVAYTAPRPLELNCCPRSYVPLPVCSGFHLVAL